MKSKYYYLLVNAYKKHGRPVSIREIGNIETWSILKAKHLKETGRMYPMSGVRESYRWEKTKYRDAIERLVKKRLAKRIKKGKRVYYKPIDMSTTMFPPYIVK